MKPNVLLMLLLIAKPVMAAPLPAQDQAPTDTLSLTQCLEQAERLNPDMGWQRAKVAEAEGKAGQQLGLMLPQVDAGLSYARYHEQLPSKRALFGPSLDDYYAEVGLRQVLFGGGRYYYGWQNARSGLEIEKAKLELIGRQTMTSVRKAYYDLSRTIMVVNIQRELVEKLGEQLRVAELLYRGGKASHVDVLRTEAQLEAQRDNLANLEQLAQARALMLGQAVGHGRPIWPRDLLSFSTEAMPQAGGSCAGNKVSKDNDLPARLNDVCVRDTFSDNPELVAFRLSVEKARNEKSSARGEILPTLSLRMNYNREDREFFPEHPNWFSSLTLNIPLFKGGAVLAQIKQAGSRLMQTEETYRKAKLSLAVRYQILRASYLDKLNRLKTIRRIVELSRQTLIAAEVRYGAGKLSAVELFDAQSAWSASEQNYINTLAEMLSASAELEGLCPNVFNNEVKP